MTAVRLGWLASLRELATRRAAIALLFALSLALVLGSIERRVGSAGALERALVPTLRLLLPVTSLAVVRSALGGERPDRAAWAIARWGASPSLVMVGWGLGAMAASAIAGVALALAPLVTAGAARGALGSELLALAPLGALAGAAYASVFLAAATVGPRAPTVLLALDALAWRADAFVLPGCHVRSLAGVAQAGSLSQRASSLALVGLFALGLALAAWRSRPRA
jgi:hypothetical protein